MHFGDVASFRVRTGAINVSTAFAVGSGGSVIPRLPLAALELSQNMLWHSCNCTLLTIM